MRLGILGGTFDPVHFGHLLMAECCLEQCPLDQLWFVPAAVPPHKQHRVLTPAKHRIEMLRLACGGDERLSVCGLEIDRGGISYTVDTLKEIRKTRPEAELYLVMGADSLQDLPNWREPERICELASVVVVGRPDVPEPDCDVRQGDVRFGTGSGQLAGRRHMRVEMPLVQFSSSDIRARVASGRSVRYRLPRAVEKYIETHGLYRDDAKNS